MRQKTVSFYCGKCGHVIVAYVWSLCGCGKRCPHCKTLHGSDGRPMLSAAEHREQRKVAG